MARMTAAQAAVYVMEKEGVSVAFGVPGAAINPLYAALKKNGGIKHVLGRHVAGASHMAEGYSRAAAGPGIDRPAVRRASRRDRIRSGYLRADGRVQADGDPRADRKSADDAQ